MTDDELISENQVRKLHAELTEARAIITNLKAIIEHQVVVCPPPKHIYPNGRWTGYFYFGNSYGLTTFNKQPDNEYMQRLQNMHGAKSWSLVYEPPQ